MTITILSGVVLLAATVMIHAVGTTSWVRFLIRKYAHQTGVFREREALRAVIWTALVLLILHLVEILLWAVAYLPLSGGQLHSFDEAAYFSIVTFTTVGYGDVTLKAAAGRLLSGIEALDGMLLLGWSTAMLYAVVHRIWAGYEGAALRDEQV
jgi:voltage-gated potassium channel